jgi:hypothetical protein
MLTPVFGDTRREKALSFQCGFIELSPLNQRENVSERMKLKRGHCRPSLSNQGTSQLLCSVMPSGRPGSLGFTGIDSVTIDVIYPSGRSAKRHYSIEVK